MAKDAQNMESRLDDIEKRLAAIEEALRGTGESGRASAVVTKTQSPKEFILEWQPKSDVEATYLFGCYAEFIRNSGPFTVDDIRGLFLDARMRVPTNVNETINKNITKGLFTAAREQKNGKKCWIVTLSGERRFKNPKAD